MIWLSGDKNLFTISRAHARQGKNGGGSGVYPEINQHAEGVFNTVSPH
jgi:hypothetical protein